MFLPFSLRCAVKAAGFSSCVALVLGFGSLAHAQNYYTTFDASEGYDSGYSLSGQKGWLTNDVFNPTNADPAPTTSQGQTIGQTDFVGFVKNYSTPSSNYLGGIGGLAPVNQVPGSPTVNVFHPVTLNGTTYALDTDLSVIPSDASFPNQDTFGFSFGKMAANSTPDLPAYTNLFGVALVPNTATNTTGTTGTDSVYYTINGQIPATELVAAGTLTMNTRYHLTISVNKTAGTFSGSYQNFLNGAPTGTALPLFSGISIGSNVANSVTDASADWVLSTNSTANPDNGGYVNAGDNYMLFNNFGVAVPEPSAWVMLALGAMGLVARFRRKARA